VTPASIEDTCQRCIERHGRFIVARRGHGWQSRHEIDKKATVCYRVTQTCSYCTQPQTLTELQATGQQQAHHVSDSRTPRMHVRMTQVTRLRCQQHPLVCKETEAKKEEAIAHMHGKDTWGTGERTRKRSTWSVHPTHPPPTHRARHTIHTAPVWIPTQSPPPLVQRLQTSSGPS